MGQGFYAASGIRDGDPDSWRREFTAYGEKLERGALRAKDAGYVESAGSGYLGAFAAYRAAAQFCSPREPGYLDLVARSEAMFQAASGLLGMPVEPLSIPFESGSLSGYIMKAADRSAPTVIVIGGGDTYREDLYFFGGAMGCRGGYNVVLVDLPGQGKTPAAGLYFRYDMELPVAAIIDHLTETGRIDGGKIIVYGISGGGYFASRAAAFEKRIAALAASTPIFDMYSVFKSEIPESVFKAPGFIIQLIGRANRVVRLQMEKYLWQAGVKSYREGIEKTAVQCVFDVEQLHCPVLAIAGEGEAEELKRQARSVIDKVGKRLPLSALREYPAESGADAHCQVNNLPLAHRELFDWFDAVLHRGDKSGKS